MILLPAKVRYWIREIKRSPDTMKAAAILVSVEIVLNQQKFFVLRYELKETADSGVTVKDLSSFVVKSVKEIEHVMNVGNTNRATGSWYLNYEKRLN